MHVNAVLANEIRNWMSHREFDADAIREAQKKGYIAPDPKTLSGLTLTSKGQDFVKKWR